LDDNQAFDVKKTISDKQLVGIWNLMEGYRVIYLVATLCQGFSAASRSGIYLLLGYYVDDVLNRGDFRTLLPVIAISFLGLSILNGAFTFLSGSLAAKTAEGIARRLRNYVYDHIQRLYFAYHDKTKTGELIQRSTSDIEALRRFFADQAIGAGRIGLLFLVNFGFLLFLNWRLALMSVVVVPITVVLSFIFFKRISTAYEAFQEQDAILSSSLQENLTGVRVVKAFARQTFEREKFDIENWEKYNRGRRLLRMHSLYWPISDILTGFQMLAGFFLGASMAIDGIISVGTYLSYAGMIVWIIWPIRNLGRLIVQMSTGLVSYNRVIEVVRQQREPLTAGDYSPAESRKGEIVFDRVGFEYEPDIMVLQDISFRCKPGDVIALLGTTGSGKTTLVNLLPRFYEYTRGSITLDGVELNKYTRENLRQQIGIVEQEPFLFSRTIRENISYGVGSEVTQDEIESAARAAAIHEVIMSFPEDYNTLVGEKGVTLSGGQKQRVAIARTILKNPSILILDDATSSVDIETEGLIRQALNKLMENRTTFIIAHRIQSVMIADLILVFDKGKIVQQGNHEQLSEEEGIYKRVFEIQTRIDEELETEVSGCI
jgi:ATP-binding cassette subfamily B protein